MISWVTTWLRLFETTPNKRLIGFQNQVAPAMTRLLRCQVDPSALAPQVRLIAVMGRQRMARLSGGQDKFRTGLRAELDGESQGGTGGLSVRIRMAVKTEINRHAVARCGERSDSE